MPFLLVGGALTVLALKYTDDALDSATTLVKWGALAGGVYIAAKIAKVI